MGYGGGDEITEPFTLGDEMFITELVGRFLVGLIFDYDAVMLVADFMSTILGQKWKGICAFLTISERKWEGICAFLAFCGCRNYVTQTKCY